MEKYFPSKPRLDLSHGFYQQIRQNQFVRAQDDHDGEINGVYAGQEIARAEGIEAVLVSLIDSDDMVDDDHPVIDMSTVDIDQYLPEAQPYILKAIEDSGALLMCDLNEVASVIVNRAWEDPTYHKAAANLCAYIMRREYLQQVDICIPLYTFRSGIITACQMVLHNWSKVRSQGAECWLSFCRFLTSMYRQIRVQGLCPTGLFNCMSQALALLGKPPCINNLEEACLLAIILYKHGHELTASNLGKMELLICDLRTAFLDPNTNGAIRSVLLLPIELSSCAWMLPESPKQYYGRNGFAKLLYKDPPKMLMNVEKFDE